MSTFAVKDLIEAATERLESAWVPLIPVLRRGGWIEIAKAQEAAERAREAKRLADLRRTERKVREHIINLGKQLRVALDIQEMVGVLSTHSELEPEGICSLKCTGLLALDVADELDAYKASA